MTMGAGLRPEAKAADEPPDPTVRAPVLDPTERRTEASASARLLRPDYRRGGGTDPRDSAEGRGAVTWNRRRDT